MTMNHATVLPSIAIFTCVLIFYGDAFAQTTPPPHQKWQPTTNAPSRSAPAKIAPGKTQTTKPQTRTSQSQVRQAAKQQGHGYSHSGGGVGVGVGMDTTIDLGGIGRRTAEPDPFAVPAGPQPVAAHTEQKEKPPAKKRSEVVKTNPFADVQLTGEQAKEQSRPQ